jgi:hypothetical protein
MDSPVAVLDYDAEEGDEDEYYDDESANEKGEMMAFWVTLEIHLTTPTVWSPISQTTDRL